MRLQEAMQRKSKMLSESTDYSGKDSATPDNIVIYSRDGKDLLYRLNFSTSQAFPFLWYDGEFLVGDYRNTHHDTIVDYIYNKGEYSSQYKDDNGSYIAPNYNDDKIEGAGRIFQTHEYNFIMFWEYRIDSIEARDIYKKLDNVLYENFDLNIDDYVALFDDPKNNRRILGIRVKDYIRGRNLMEIHDFFDFEEGNFNRAKSKYDNFSSSQDPNDDEHMRIQRYREWNGYGREVAESIKKEDIATPDSIDITQSNGKRISRSYTAKTCYPFGIRGNKLYVGDYGKTHYEIKNGLERDDYQIAGRIFIGNSYAFLTLWNHTQDTQKTRNDVKKVYQLFLINKGLNIGDYTFLLYYAGTVHAAKVKDYIRGYELRPYDEYEEFENNPANFAEKTKYEPFSNPRDPDDDEFRRIQRYRLWHGLGGLEVAENIKKNKNRKNMTISESQLKKMIAKSIKEAINEMDADMRSQLLRSFYSDVESRRMPKEKYPFKDNGKKSKYETEPVKQDKKK